MSEPAASRWRTVGALGGAQTLAWASSYYLPAVLAAPIARDLQLATPTVFALFSLALFVSAAVGPMAGRLIDRYGGRPVLLATNLVFALALGMLSQAQGLATLTLAWVLLGLAMGSGLYEAAFASLVRLFGKDSRNAITGITLIAGFASTVGWPLSAWMESHWGWRGACLGWAALHLALGLPLNALLPQARGAAAPHDAPAQKAPAAHADAHPDAAPTRWRSLILLSYVFAVTGFISTAMAAHLPGLFQVAVGASAGVAVAAGALIGPAQVGARLVEFGLLRRWHPLLSARIAMLTHPLGIAVLLAGGVPAAAAFALLHGAGNGMMTIAKGTLPLALFGPQGYGARQGWLMMPTRVMAALAPVLFGLAIEHWGRGAAWLSAGLGFSGLAALLVLKLAPAAAPTVPAGVSTSPAPRSDP